MLIMTSERCPECDNIIYMKCMPKRNNEGYHGALDHVTSMMNIGDDEWVEMPHTIADGIYLDDEGMCCVTMFDEDTHLPTYVCIFCNWRA